MKKKTDGLRQPFFASFLEGQEKQAIQGGDDPSPTNVIADQAQTQKYPSDQEDSSPTDVLKDRDGGYVTMKAPSDSDEGGLF